MTQRRSAAARYGKTARTVAAQARGHGAAFAHTTAPYAAAGAAIGSWLLLPVPLIAAALLAGLCLWRPRPALVLAALVALTSAFGTRAVDGLNDPPTGPVDAWVTLLDDPRPLPAGGIRVTVRHDGKRLEAQAYGRAAAQLDNLLAGERVHVSGAARAVSGDFHRWRHVASVLSVDEVHDVSGAAPVAGLANRVRRLLASGAESLAEDHRALFSGMVYGDDRHQSARLADDFRAAGLGHLLVVSGQNVAFVLALASPLLGRMRPGVRLLALLAVLGVFAMLTRFEPSVLRAVTMAGFAVVSAALGRPEAGRRTLLWAIALVLVVDPFLVRSLAFQLSVCATAGILWITPALAEAMRGPRSLRLAICTTAGAQVAVMPLLVAVFGSVPVASLPANLIAGPASAPVMMWGLTGGVAAGVAGGWPAWLLHRPTELLLWWVRGTAGAAAAGPPAVIGVIGAVMIGVGVLLVLAPRLRASRQSREASPGPGRVEFARLLRTLGFIVIAVALVGSLVSAPVPPPGWSQIPGARVYSADAQVLVLDSARSPQRLLADLRDLGVRRVDLVVAATGGASDARAVVALADRFGEVAIVAPPMHRVPGARTVRTGAVARIGTTSVEIVAHNPGLVVEVFDGDASRQHSLAPHSPS